MKTKLTAVVGALLIAWTLKDHYSAARPDDLRWILTPTARLVAAVTGTTFVWQPGEGYFAREQLFLIEKACAGVNFVIAAFVMLVWAFVPRARSFRSVLGVLGLSLSAGYAAAVLVNTVRIAIAMRLAAHPATLSGFSAADVHRVEGIVVYFGGLVALYEMARWFEPRLLRGLRS
jgi:exosortase K